MYSQWTILIQYADFESWTIPCPIDWKRKDILNVNILIHWYTTPSLFQSFKKTSSWHTMQFILNICIPSTFTWKSCKIVCSFLIVDLELSIQIFFCSIVLSSFIQKSLNWIYSKYLLMIEIRVQSCSSNNVNLNSSYLYLYSEIQAVWLHLLTSQPCWLCIALHHSH